MSLAYSGYHVSLDINPGDAQNHVHVTGYAAPSNDSLEDAKKAFLQAMVEFTNHPKFNELTYELMSEFNIQVLTSTCTSV